MYRGYSVGVYVRTGFRNDDAKLSLSLLDISAPGFLGGLFGIGIALRLVHLRRYLCWMENLGEGKR